MKPWILGMATFGLLFAGVGQANADIQAYFTSDTRGNQIYESNLGLDFNVNGPITITALGAFDSGQLPFVRGITVGIFQRLPGGDPNNDHFGNLLTSVTISGNQGMVSGNYRFVQLSSPLVLQPGFYDVTAIGFNAVNLDLNENFNDGSLIQTNDGGGLLSFVGTGRFNDLGINTRLDYPYFTSEELVGLQFNTPHVFGGGSFLFKPGVAAVPEPTSLTLLGIGAAGLLGYGWRRRKQAAAYQVKGSDH
jgi:hypothetical protein